MPSRWCQADCCKLLMLIYIYLVFSFPCFLQRLSSSAALFHVVSPFPPGRVIYDKANKALASCQRYQEMNDWLTWQMSLIVTPNKLATAGQNCDINTMHVEGHAESLSLNVGTNNVQRYWLLDHLWTFGSNLSLHIHSNPAGRDKAMLIKISHQMLTIIGPHQK